MARVLKMAAVTAAVALLLGIIFYYAGRDKGPEGYIESVGTIEATEVNLAPRIQGTVVWMCCDEGDAVKAKQTAFRLDAAELKARLEEASAALKGAQEAIKEAKVAIEGARARRESARHDVEAASSEVKRSAALVKEAEENLKRSEALFKDGYITNKDLDAARAVFDSRRAELASMQARRRGAEANLRNSGISIRAAEARIPSLEAERARAAAQIEVIKAELEYKEAASPIDGVISYKAFETGEFVNPGETVYTIYDTINIWARADIEETAIQKIKLGAAAGITPAGGAEAFRGKVREIGEVGGFATQRDVTRGRPDIKTFRVEIAVEEPRGVLKPGMTVNVRIFTDGAR